MDATRCRLNNRPRGSKGYTCWPRWQRIRPQLRLASALIERGRRAAEVSPDAGRVLIAVLQGLSEAVKGCSAVANKQRLLQAVKRMLI